MDEKDKIIVRQNVLNRAVELLINGNIDQNAMFTVAEEMEAWVWKATNTGIAAATGPKPVLAKCEMCDVGIKSQKVIDYSKKMFNKVLCYECQKKSG